jgi:hypothetical protein
MNSSKYIGVITIWFTTKEPKRLAASSRSAIDMMAKSFAILNKSHDVEVSELTGSFVMEKKPGQVNALLMVKANMEMNKRGQDLVEKCADLIIKNCAEALNEDADLGETTITSSRFNLAQEEEEEDESEHSCENCSGAGIASKKIYS